MKLRSITLLTSLALCAIVRAQVFVGTYGGLHYFVTEAGTYGDARSWAQQQGADLVSIHSSDQNAWLSQTLADYGRCWIGLTDRVTEGQWKWEDGTSLDYLNWGQNEPKSALGTEDFAFIHASDGGVWRATGFDGAIEVPLRGVYTSPVPEPAVLAGLVAGLLALVRRRR